MAVIRKDGKQTVYQFSVDEALDEMVMDVARSEGKDEEPSPELLRRLLRSGTDSELARINSARINQTDERLDHIEKQLGDLAQFLKEKLG